MNFRNSGGLFKCSLVLFALLLTLNEVPMALAQDSRFLEVTGPCHLGFPRDHGSHPGYRTEWWYYTGNVSSERGEGFGFQLTFFRRQIAPPSAEEDRPNPPSAWRTDQLYLAHAALSDIGGKRFYHAEKTARGALGLGGVEKGTDAVTVFLGNWSSRIGFGEHILTADTDDFSFSLTLKPQKEPIPHGESGYSRKGMTAERASCYYSFTRLAADGTLNIGGKTFKVKGSTWMDHEFSSAPLEGDLVGWDWFSLQLSNHTELMIYLLRKKDGTWSPVSSGTFVDSSGKSVHLEKEAFGVQVLDYWRSPHSQGQYPARWRLGIPSLQLDLTVTPNLQDQEMLTTESTRITYWEGSVACTGTMQGFPITGRGYVELTGYAQPMNSPL